MAASASAVAKEWTTANEFPAPTREALVTLLTRLQQDGMSSLRVLLLGKNNVGKSSTVNTIMNERVCSVSPFQQGEQLRPVFVTRTMNGFTLQIIDSPGLGEASNMNEASVNSIRGAILDAPVDVVLYVDRFDVYRLGDDDRKFLRQISTAFGPQVWKRAVILLTHANITPATGQDYSSYSQKRREVLQRTVKAAAGGANVPIVLIENSSRCPKNESGEKVLSSSSGGTPWLHEVLSAMGDAAARAGPRLVVTKQLMEGPAAAASKRGKFWVPIFILLEFFLVVKPLLEVIRADREEERQHRQRWEVRAEEYERMGGVRRAMERQAALRRQQQQKKPATP